MANWLPGITINNGSAWSASYATAACSPSGYCSSASVLLGNYTSSTGQSITEITVASPLSLTTAGVLGLITPLPIASGGTNATSVATANQTMTPATVTLGGGSTSISWSASNSFHITLASSSTFSFANAIDGQVIMVEVVQASAASYSVTWPNSTILKWSGGTAPTMSTGFSKTDIYSVYYNATTNWFYGVYVQNF